MGKSFFSLVLGFAIACGGQVAGGTSGNEGGAGCTTNSQCPSGQLCGFEESAKCSAVGQCFPNSGSLCNSFQPGCSCAGQTVNVVCNGLPSGYAPAAVTEVGAACPDAGPQPPPVAQFPCGATDCNSGQQVCYNDTSCVPSNDCTTCTCAQALFQCTSTCKQANQAIYVQCE